MGMSYDDVVSPSSLSLLMAVLSCVAAAFDDGRMMAAVKKSKRSAAAARTVVTRQPMLMIMIMMMIMRSGVTDRFFEEPAASLWLIGWIAKISFVRQSLTFLKKKRS